MSAKKTKAPDRLAIYVGRRLWHTRAGKTLICQEFLLLPDKTPMSYSGIRGVIIGGVYKCHQDTMPRRPELEGPPVLRNEEWNAKDALVDAYREGRRAEAKAKALAGKPIKDALAVLEPLFRNLSYGETHSLLTHLVNKLKVRKK